MDEKQIEYKPQNNFHWCWNRCQWMSIAACESRVKKGTCKMLPKPKLLEPWKVETWKHFLHKDVGEATMECEEGSRKVNNKEPEAGESQALS